MSVCSSVELWFTSALGRCEGSVLGFCDGVKLKPEEHYVTYGEAYDQKEKKG